LETDAPNYKNFESDSQKQTRDRDIEVLNWRELENPSTTSDIENFNKLAGNKRYNFWDHS
jgi:hypothetical protein